MPGRGQATYTPEALEAKIDQYFDWCNLPENHVETISGKHRISIPRPPMWVDLSVYLGVDRETLRRWMNGEYHSIQESRKGLSPDEVAQAEKKAQERVRGILTRARDRIVTDAYLGASRGVYNERATALRLGRMGETPKTEVQHSGAMTVAWEGVSAGEAEDYAR